jgi:hypothetical protein
MRTNTFIAARLQGYEQRSIGSTSIGHHEMHLRR